jgi:flavin reductase (DIM6/NTAB) family NADH-FMN oxidoreductase RutF
MELNTIDINHFATRSFSIWKDKWMLLTAGSFEDKKFNCMTISWGSIGIMWNKPFVQVAVRPTRHTFQFINKYPDFTLCVFPEKYRTQLQELGSKSGRSMDKISHSGLTPMKSAATSAPAYEEAELVFDAARFYWQDYDSKSFFDAQINTHYTNNDYHRIYFGEILSIRGVPQYHS